MNWEKAHAVTKGILYIIADAALLGGAVFGALTLGTLVFAIQLQTGSPAPHLFGLAAGVSFYLAGLAGRDRARPFLKRHLLPPPKTDSPSLPE